MSELDAKRVTIETEEGPLVLEERPPLVRADPRPLPFGLGRRAPRLSKTVSDTTRTLFGSRGSAGTS